MQTADGPTNMALDAELLAAAESGKRGFRVYQWDGPWVSLGRFQRPERAVAHSWQSWCKRPTGGRAVLHGHDLTLAYAQPLAGDGRQIKTVYRKLIVPLVEALNACDLECYLAENTRHVGGDASEDCFAFRSPNDIVCPHTGKKVCGCALRITEHAALLQASIPYKNPLVDPNRAIVGGLDHPGLQWDFENFGEAVNRVMASK